MSVVLVWLFAAAGLAAAQEDAYTVGPGDTLTVQVYEEPELSGEVVVSEGCTVSLGLIGSLSVCGATPSQLEARIAEAYRGDYLVHPTVAVKVAAYKSRRVDVLGEVVKRGPLYLEGRTTLLEIISLAGGPTADNVVQVEVVSADGSRRTYDLLSLTAADETVLVKAGDKIVLKPGQVVYVEGEITRPGTVTMTDGLTVTQALALAGGPEEYANLRRVVIRRADGSQMKVNVVRIHKGLDDDPVLASDDHLLVPRGAF